jgi:ferredoxin
MRIRIDAERCTGHGRCYSLAPELFDCDDDGNGFVRVDAELTDEQLPRAELAVNSCPERAITLA